MILPACGANVAIKEDDISYTSTPSSLTFPVECFQEVHLGRGIPLWQVANEGIARIGQILWRKSDISKYL